MADDLRADLGRLVRQLLEGDDARRTGESIAPVLRGLSDLSTDEPCLPNVGPPEFVNAPVGPDRTLA
jgi:hypothetical protein